MSGWQGDLVKQFDALAERAVLQQKFAIVAYLMSRIVQYSPVDTGAFRSNHRLAASVTKEQLPINESPADVVKRAEEAVAAVPVFETVYIQNSLPYSVALENGHSKQAPDGVYKVAVNDTIERFKR